ncbi:MAG: BamA/TamA family outer membrane protein [Chitinophagaceae bacterium]|nr:BamA/TamA family outer membrane protein [Chitinophagaceae bacterium]
MLPGLSSFSSVLFKAIFAGWLLMTVVSCTVVKKYQPNKPFVYKTNINLIGNFPSDEKESLISGLKGQLDDSLRARRLDKLLWSVLKNPPLYDSTNADKSILFMRALLVSLGYFHDSISYKDTIIRHSKDQFRTIITFDVKPGRQWKLDSIAYTIKHPELQRLTDSTRSNAFIKKGDPFAKAPISAELDRLTELYRNNGYLRFIRDEIVGVWDTLDVALLQPSLDPFEQLELLQRLRERRDSPTVNLELRLRNIDSARLTKYYNGHVTLYPDYSIDTIGLEKKETMVKGIRVIQFRNTFKPKIFPSNIYLPYGTVYSQRRYIRTINRLNIIGAWQIVNIEQVPRKDQDTVDYVIKLTPAKKRLFSANLEGSFNQSAISGNLFGIGVNVGLQNRNFLKAANLANTNFRYGIEFGGSGTNQFIQTKQASVSHNIYFPKAIIFDKWIRDNRKDNWRTILSLNAANTDRRFLFNLTTLNGSWGYEYQYRTLLVNFKFPNIEYSFLDRRDSLNTLIDDNPSLRNIFTDGLVLSAVINLTKSFGSKNRPVIFRANFEGAPLPLSFFHSPFLDTQVYRFIKIDADIAHLIRYKKSSIALHFFAGIGIADPFNTTVNPNKRNALPFFKQYFSGGPNSMRAWALRRLGQGSAIKDFGSFPDRYGDVQLEANAEYRFPIFKAVGIPVNGAIFTDIGNVWFLKKKAGDPEQVFNAGRLGKDIAIGAGAGLRIDFGFFVLRLDYSYKIKDPSPSPEYASAQNKWFAYSFFKGDQFQLGINLPFIF